MSLHKINLNLTHIINIHPFFQKISEKATSPPEPFSGSGGEVKKFRLDAIIRDGP